MSEPEDQTSMEQVNPHPECDRRSFLSGIVAQASALALFLFARKAAASGGHGAKPVKPGGHRWGMSIDLDKCTACGSCVVACAQENNLMLGSAEDAAMERVIRWLDILPVSEGEFPAPKQKLLPMPCQHCDDPPCARVCPVYATFANEEGIIGQVYTRCIGCRYCIQACPYTCKFFNFKKPAWPAEMKASLNPDVSVRSVGVVEKCLFCHHRLQRAKEKASAEGNRPLTGKDYQTACAEVCPSKAIVFGDLGDPDSDVSILAKDERSFQLLEGLGLGPKVRYLRSGE